MKKSTKIVYDIPIDELISTLQKILKSANYIDLEIVNENNKTKLVLYPVKDSDNVNDTINPTTLLELPPQNPEVTDETNLYELF